MDKFASVDSHVGSGRRSSTRTVETVDVMQLRRLTVSACAEAGGSHFEQRF